MTERRALVPVVTVVVVTFAVLVVGIAQFWLLQRSLDRQIALTDVLAAEHDQIFQLVNEETGVRGYVATVDPLFLQIYYASVPRVSADEASVAGATSGVRGLQARIRTYRDATAAVQRYFLQELRFVASTRVGAARAELQYGMELFDRLRAADASAERQASAELLAQRYHTGFLARAGVAAGLFFAALLVLWTIAFAVIWGRARLHRRDALSDPLTGVTNRRGAYLAIESFIRNGAPESFGLVFIDLDGFKKINDVYGHAIGDAILKIVATRLRSQLRDRDRVCRLGGDEFACIISPPTNIQLLRGIGLRLQKAVARPVSHEQDDYVIGCSAGICIYPEHGTTANGLLENADRAMYHAKARGGGVSEWAGNGKSQTTRYESTRL